MQAAARVHKDRIRRAGFERGHIGQADGIVGPLARKGAGRKDGHGNIAHPHKALDALGAVGQRGGDGTLAAVSLGAHKAVLIHGRHTLVAGGPENFLPAIFLVRLVGGQVRVGVLAVQVQLRLAGIVKQRRRGRFSVAAGNFTESKRPHDKINVNSLALDAVVRARFGIAALPHIVGAGVAQFVRKAGDPEILAPGVKRRIAEAGAHPVERGVDALLAGVAQLGQAVKKRLGDGGHLVREDAADALVLKVVVDRVGQLVGRGGVILESLLRRRDQTQQAGNMLGLAAGFVLGRRVGVDVRAERDALAGTFVGVAAPLRVVLVPALFLAVPLAAEAAADDGKIDAVVFGLFPVDCALIFRYINAF